MVGSVSQNVQILLETELNYAGEGRGKFEIEKQPLFYLPSHKNQTHELRALEPTV